MTNKEALDKVLEYSTAINTSKCCWYVKSCLERGVCKYPESDNEYCEYRDAFMTIREALKSKIAPSEFQFLETIYGYPVSDLVWFAKMCRSAHIKPEDIKSIGQYLAEFREILEKEYMQILFDSLQQMWKKKSDESNVEMVEDERGN